MCYNAMILRINSALLSAVKQLIGNLQKLRKELMRIPFHRFKTFFYIFAVCFCFYGDQPPRWIGHPEIKFNFFHYTLQRKGSANSALQPKVWFSPSFLDPFEHNLSQNSPIKRLFQPTLGHISTLGSKLSLSNWRYWPWFKGAKLDSKIGLSLKRTHF